MPTLLCMRFCMQVEVAAERAALEDAQRQVADREVALEQQSMQYLAAFHEDRWEEDGGSGGGGGACSTFNNVCKALWRLLVGHPHQNASHPIQSNPIQSNPIPIFLQPWLCVPGPLSPGGLRRAPADCRLLAGHTRACMHVCVCVPAQASEYRGCGSGTRAAASAHCGAGEEPRRGEGGLRHGEKTPLGPPCNCCHVQRLELCSQPANLSGTQYHWR